MRLVASEIDHMTPSLLCVIGPCLPSFVDEFPSKQVLRRCTILYLEGSYCFDSGFSATFAL
jgi:hypothetical protein